MFKVIHEAFVSGEDCSTKSNCKNAHRTDVHEAFRLGVVTYLLQQLDMITLSGITYLKPYNHWNEYPRWTSLYCY